MSQIGIYPGLPTQNVQYFTATAPTSANRHWQIWHKPRYAKMLFITLHGPGGNGGAGAIGANSAAAGGGGGGSGAKSTLLVPTALLPDVLYVSVGKSGSVLGTQVTIAPTSPAVGPTANYLLLTASQGGNGGNAAGATAGAAGTAGSAITLAGCPLAGLGVFQFFSGQVGIIGGVAVAGANAALPTTGNNTTGGCGGGGLPAAAAAGTNGGSIAGIAQSATIHELKTVAGGVGSATATNPAQSGSHGYSLGTFAGNFYYLGGGGGASTHGTATGAGLVQSNGGDGNIGCGGGGSGGALTGSVAGVPGRGGNGLAIFVWW